jgi:iron complex outermembrane receptor protein
LSFGPEDRRWSLAAYVRNIENERTTAYSYTHPIARAVVNGSSAPRTYGLRATFSF